MVLPGPLHDSKKNIFQILCGSCFQYECHYINTSGTTDNSIFVNEGRFLLKAVVQDTILDTIHSSKVHEVKQGYDNLHEPSSQEFKIQNQNSKSKKCPPGVATYYFSFKQLDFWPANPHIFKNHNNFASNSRASNRKFSATFINFA